MKKFIADLHLHSTASDGELSPALLVQRCKLAGLKAMTITDHDSIAGVAPARAEGARQDIEVISGCELTGYLDNVELHILSLFIDTSESSPVVQMIDEVRKLRPKRALEIAQKIRSLGVPLKDEDVLDEVVQSYSPGRAHVAAALVKKGFVKNMNEAFEKYLKPSAPAYLPKVRLEPQNLIDAVHQSGGLAILAHPAQYNRDELIPVLFKMGLDGLEIYHHSHSLLHEAKYADLAKRFKGVTSGGSDYHGPRMKPGIEIRSSGTTEEMLLALKERVSHP